MEKRIEKAGADVQPERIDKQYQAECFGIAKHAVIDSDSVMTGNDAYEEYKCNS